jgi:uncharacterized membrane protein YccC
MRFVDRFLNIRTKSFPWLKDQAFEHSARTAVAAVVSLLTARLFGLSEAYWAAITTLIVMQSNVKATLIVSLRRLIGTALGVSIGAGMAVIFGSNVLVFGAGIFLLGMLCSLLGRTNQRLPEYLDRTAYRYGGVALAIVMLVRGQNTPWITALHRFIEVSIGIAVGLALTMLWPEREPRG